MVQSHCRLPDGNLIDYRYLTGGRLSAIDLNGQPLTRHQFEAGREIQRQQGTLLSQYHYDEEGRLQAHRVSQQQNRLYQRHYHYDAAGNLSAVEDSLKGSRQYQYDPLNRLVAVRGEIPETFVHDPVGNLLRQNSQPLANVSGNRLLMQGDRDFDYDGYGNLIRERRGQNQQLVTDYHYDGQHRLDRVTLPNGDIATYRYDAFGRRVSKTVNGITTEFVWQGDRLVAESSPGHYQSYLYEPDSFKPLTLLRGYGPEQAQTYYYQLDHLGTPQELTAASGSICWSARYQTYGNLARLEVEEIINPLRFQGQYHDAETCLYYNRHRYYNPGTGRFLTPDPIRLAGGMNNYQYVPNPTGWVDPLGLKADKPEPGGDGENGGGRQDGKVDEGEPGVPKVTHSKLWSVDPAMQAADEASGVLINGRYIKKPTAKNINDMLNDSGRVGSKNTNGKFMYVVDQDGNLILGTRSGQRMPHPTLVGGENSRVFGAGIVELRAGKIYMVDNASGHFKPGAGSLDAAKNAFSKIPERYFSKEFKGYKPYVD